jgi:SAM-dependent methyltransferase
VIEIKHVSNGASRIAYEELYSSRELEDLDGYYRWLVSLLHPCPGSCLLDIACGEGRLLYWAHRAGLRVWGCDFSCKAVAAARQKAPHAHVVVANGERLPFSAECFEYITSIGSLEHYEDLEQGTREIARLLMPSGRACILLPNSFGLLWNINYVRRTGDVCDDGQPIQRYATLKEWQRLLERNGLQVLSVAPYRRAFPASRRDWSWYLRHPHKLLTTLLIRALIPTNLASMFAFLCQRVPSAAGVAETTQKGY